MGNKPRMAYFWAFGLGLLLLVYGLRLIIRSQLFRRLIDHMNGQAATAGRTTLGQEIPTSVWLRSVWISAWSNPLTWCILALTLVGLPLIFVWSPLVGASHWKLWQSLLATNFIVGLF